MRTAVYLVAILGLVIAFYVMYARNQSPLTGNEFPEFDDDVTAESDDGSPATDSSSKDDKDSASSKAKKPVKLATATFGNGCFWCTEAVFERIRGVSAVESGYSGGHVDKPTYRQVTSGTSGHAEVVQLRYDPSVVSYAELLEVFWQTHDPTTKNRQGNDYGPQYRSAIFYHDEEQKKLAEHYMKKLDAAKVFRAPIVTEITKFEKFFPAEDYHQDYFELNGQAGYCQAVIQPKIDKLEKVFKEKLK